ncbi:DUF3792 family protein [bacterium]|nr:DUF3792 family protein [bacterium]
MHSINEPPLTYAHVGECRGGFCVEKTVNTAWYAKKCALGTLVCCGTELVLLMLASALILHGAISEEMANGTVLVCTAVAAFLGCMIGARKTSKRAMMTAGCAASAWVTMQVIGFFVYDGLTPERSLELAAAMAVGAVAPLLLQRNGKKGRGAKARARRKRR